MKTKRIVSIILSVLMACSVFAGLSVAADDSATHTYTVVGVAGHGDTGRLDLVAGDPRGLSGLEAELTISNGVAAGRLAGHTTALNATIFHSLRQKHY